MSITSASRTQLASSSAMPADATIPIRRKLPWRQHITPTEVILSHPYRGAGSESDPFIVEWLPDDAENPQNWKSVGVASQSQ